MCVLSVFLTNIVNVVDRERERERERERNWFMNITTVADTASVGRGLETGICW